ncbi:MAG: hypothetical protein HQM09_08700 [Candidatus Riflebacteria bacterium]|nr:hypothetical protein [Candidatus Riflebacteria bacterium]
MIAERPRQNFPEIIDLLLKAGSPIDTPDASGCTPLHVAVAGAEEEVIRKLVAGGSATETKTESSAENPAMQRYQDAYERYQNAVAQGRSESEVSSAMSDYRKAYEDYLSSIHSQSSKDGYNKNSSAEIGRAKSKLSSSEAQSNYRNAYMKYLEAMMQKKSDEEISSAATLYHKAYQEFLNFLRKPTSEVNTVTGDDCSTTTRTDTTTKAVTGTETESNTKTQTQTVTNTNTNTNTETGTGCNTQTQTQTVTNTDTGCNTQTQTQGTDASEGFAGNDPEIQRIFREELTPIINQFVTVSTDFNRIEHDIWGKLTSLDAELLSKEEYLTEHDSSNISKKLTGEINDFFASIRNKKMSPEVLKQVQEFRDSIKVRIDNEVEKYRKLRENGLEALKAAAAREEALLPQLSPEAREARNALSENMARLHDDCFQMKGDNTYYGIQYPDAWKKAGFSDACLEKINNLSGKANSIFSAKEAIFKDLSNGSLSPQDIQRAKDETKAIDDVRSELDKERSSIVKEGIREMGITDEAAISDIYTAIWNGNFEKASTLISAQRTGK